MNRMLFEGLKKGVLFILLLTGLTASADIVYPARLQLVETAPGVFEVFYVLPVIQGKIVKAQAVFPGFCESLTEPVIEIDPYQKKVRWQISCGINSLAGEQIGIEGLLGSQIDIILEVNTLDGRVYKSTLSPARAFYTIPEAPGLYDFLKIGTLSAGRYALITWGLFLMALVYFLPRAGSGLGLPALALSAGLGLGYFLSWSEWLLVPAWAGPVISLLVTALIASGPAFKNRMPSGSVFNSGLLGLAAIFSGAGFRKEELLSGYTQGEEITLLCFAFLGFLGGALLLLSIARQVWRVLELRTESYRIPGGTLLTGIALGILVWELSLFWNVPSMLPSIPLSLLSLILVLALWNFYSGNKIHLAFVLPGLVMGYAAGVYGLSLPYSWALLLGVQSLMLILIFFKKSISREFAIAMLILSGIAGGNYLHYFASDTLSYPLARSVFFILFLIVVTLVLSLLLERIKSPARRDSLLKTGSLVMLGTCLFLSMGFLYETYEYVVSPAISAGFFPVPVVSILLLILAFLYWPRRRKILEKMQVTRKTPVISVFALFLAIYLLPLGLKMKNPWYSVDQLKPEVVHDIVENKLLNTYTAFNIEDEEMLFEKLNENLEEGLLDHIYLDSRRRLNMGLREGSKVTVKEVTLGDLGSSLSEGTSTEGMRYPATWTVTAQVKHLKHIHYRKNKYTGTIALKSIDNTWKISEITLISEDRQVIASSRL